MSEAVRVRALSAEEILAQSELNIDDWMDDGQTLRWRTLRQRGPLVRSWWSLLGWDGLKPGRQGLTGKG